MLHERSDFTELLTQVGESSGAGAGIVEKDYWVTEALRVIADSFFDGVVFKGGTSLSKAWGLIARFSEDIDLLVRTDGGRLATRGARDRYLKEIAGAVAGIGGLEPQSEGQSSRGISRTAVLAYEPRTPTPGLSPTIVLEMGVRGGPHPVETRALTSMLADAFAGTGVEDESLSAFAMVVLHPRRTFVEKLFAINSACELFSEGRESALARPTRHLADLYFLLGDPDVAEFIGSKEYRDLLPEVDAISNEHFPRDHRAPTEMRFAGSRALAPEGGLRTAIEADYARSGVLFYGDRPDLAAIYERIAEVADRL